MATGGNRQADIKRFFAVSLPKSTHVKRQISAVPHTGIDGGSERYTTTRTRWLWYEWLCCTLNVALCS
jgi:hypothetical protein